MSGYLALALLVVVAIGLLWADEASRHHADPGWARRSPSVPPAMRCREARALKASRAWPADASRRCR